MSEVLGIGLPSGWAAAPLKRVTSVLNRGSAPNYVDDGPVRAISQAANQAGGLDWSRTRFHDFAGDPLTLKGSLRPGDVLINSTGTGTLGRVGYFAGASDEIPCMADSHVTVARAEAGKLDSRFAYYWLGSVAFYHYIYTALVVGATNQIELNRDRLGDAPVPLPPLEEQRRIADFLDTQTTRIDRLAVLRDSLKDRLDERDRALRDGLVNRLAEKAGEAPLRRFTTRIEQGASPQCDAVPRENDGEWGVLKLSAVKRGRFDPAENKRLPADVDPAVAYQVRPGDLLVTRANTPGLVGDAAVVVGEQRKLLLPDLIYRVGLMPEMNAHFVAQVALSGRVRSLIEAVARGSSQSMVKLRGEDIKAWPVPLASSAQQTALVEQLRCGMEATGSLRSVIARQAALLAERRQALITAAVTGQFDVSTASGRNVTEGITA
ncbi:restriction endonuclease subunit S [Streptomyces sp. 2RAF24]|uniref:restriction endonuclease subunit S n=1 Tax=Streptomyces sp. 2RAF24 TaxID=3232997 RepID=UPI003F9890A9